MQCVRVRLGRRCRVDSLVLGTVRSLVFVRRELFFDPLVDLHKLYRSTVSWCIHESINSEHDSIQSTPPPYGHPSYTPLQSSVVDTKYAHLPPRGAGDQAPMA